MVRTNFRKINFCAIDYENIFTTKISRFMVSSYIHYYIYQLALHTCMCLILQHSSVAQQEQQEKAWLRHKHALAKVKLERVSVLPFMHVHVQ